MSYRPLGRAESRAQYVHFDTVWDNLLSVHKYLKRSSDPLFIPWSRARRGRRSEASILAVQANLANTYGCVGRLEDSSEMYQDVYSGYLKLLGREHQTALTAATNYASTLRELQRFDEAKALLRRTMPVVRRVLGEGCDTTLRMRWCYAQTLYCDLGSTLNDLNEAVSTLEAAERTARRVLGGAHPITTEIESDLQDARAALRARETPSPGAA